MEFVGLILIQLIFILAIIFVVSSIIKKVSQKAASFNATTIKWIFIGYITILVAATIFLFVVPIGVEEKNVSINEARQIEENFYNATHEGNLEKIEGLLTIDEWEFSFEEPVLHLNLNQGDQSSMRILVKNKDTNDGNVNIVHYSTPYFTLGVDVTHVVRSPQLEMINGTLEIGSTWGEPVRMAKFHKEFTITQFTGEGMFYDGHLSRVGTNALYIKVPANVEISAADYVHIEYVRP
ncbi:hypothetical protein BKP35_11900 [Anaerobacillus arseniciselenatis]|uniref:Uncharacterized protein n=1 Tax=Anaerobacillus arseniciselenatis TaxID=85682 RepID=A0A1S2LH43_9BACI|nr:hypothetical protein [Anaerobacillus arseniciselenatis]OIJ11634.1 hypothetical protein BKP35_11900 [Anaerobacillus arseniciselenatis]